MHEVTGSIPVVSTKRKADGDDVRFSFGGDLFGQNSSRKARIWFAFLPKSDGSFLDWITIDDEAAVLRSDARSEALIKRLKVAAKSLNLSLFSVPLL